RIATHPRIYGRRTVIGAKRMSDDVAVAGDIPADRVEQDIGESKRVLIDRDVALMSGAGGQDVVNVDVVLGEDVHAGNAALQRRTLGMGDDVDIAAGNEIVTGTGRERRVDDAAAGRPDLHIVHVDVVARLELDVAVEALDVDVATGEKVVAGGA